MLTRQVLLAAAVQPPPAGILRVAPDPVYLEEGPWPPGTGPNRFDDPQGSYAVRYGAGTLTGCLKELLARFRVKAPFENLLAVQRGLGAAAPVARDPSVWLPGDHPDELDPDLDDVPYPPGADPGPNDGLAEWLRHQRVARLHPPPDLLYADAYNDALLNALSDQPRVSQVLGSPLARHLLGPTVWLDQTLVRLSDSQLGRPLTQAISRALFDADPAPDGIAYASRIDSTEQCWALYGRTPVEHDEIPWLLGNHEHEAALRSVANWHELRLPYELGLAQDG